MYTRIKMRQAWNWGPFIFLRWMVIGAAINAAAFYMILWWVR
jgi:hypothetical protein